MDFFVFVFLTTSQNSVDHVSVMIKHMFSANSKHLYGAWWNTQAPNIIYSNIMLGAWLG